MIISFVEISNFRRLQSIHIDFDKTTTIFVGANNSGKTSAMVALRYFLLFPDRLVLKDITISHWTKIDLVGKSWEQGTESDINIDDLLPAMDVWLEVPLSEIQHVAHLVPTLDWNGGLLGVRLKFHISSTDDLKREYLSLRKPIQSATVVNGGDGNSSIEVWPKSLSDFLERRLQAHTDMDAYVLDPKKVAEPTKGEAIPQLLPQNALPIEKNPLRNLIKIDEIAAQRDFADAGERGHSGHEEKESAARKFKRRLSVQLRSYYDKHLDPAKTPSDADFETLSAIQTAERNFDKRLKDGFAAAFEELEDLGYPGITNPKLLISTQLNAADGLKHSSALQYQVADPSGDGTKPLKLPEDYSGLGYQNLIAMVFMLMSFRDEWMRIGKAAANMEDRNVEQIQPLHLVLVE